MFLYRRTYTTDGCVVTASSPPATPPFRLRPHSVMLQVLYKLKTAKVFDRNRSKEDKGSMEVSDEDPFAIQIMAWCPESRMLCVAGVSANILVYRFSKLEVTTEVVQVGDALATNPCFSFPLLFTEVLGFLLSLCRHTQTRTHIDTLVDMPCQQQYGCHANRRSGAVNKHKWDRRFNVAPMVTRALVEV